ncbi:MAG: hypothetical protein ACI9QL_003461 [Candidatus Omnitrophota bacterium]|jgi:hypothetical protein
MATFRQATIAGEQMENPVFTGPSDIYSVYWISTLCTGFFGFLFWISSMDWVSHWADAKGLKANKPYTTHI